MLNNNNTIETMMNAYYTVTEGSANAGIAGAALLHSLLNRSAR